ncbi:YadA-like family protein [Salmonella enterica]|nr:YadA-like family protein [Salmonella enterica]
MQSAGRYAKEKYEALKAENAEETKALTEYANTVVDERTARLVKIAIDQRERAAKILEAWADAAKDFEGVHAEGPASETHYKTGSGRGLRPSSTITETGSAAVRKNADDLTAQLNAVLTGPGAATSVAAIKSITETLATGQAAKGSMLLLPGEKKGEGNVAITSGVLDRAADIAGYETRIRSIGSGEAGILEKTTGGEGENASLVMIGDNVHATIGAGESAILIGDNSSTTGNGIAIGKNTASTNNSIALGNDSVSTEPDELSIGNNDGLNRKITHMADGTKDTDGATVHNINEATELLENKLTTSIGKSHDDAIGQAKKYTDNTISDANDKVLREATTYTDDTAKETLKTANEHTERRAVIAENNAVTRSNTYTDESSSRTLEKANTYTNHQVAQAENNAVTRSNDYTNKRFGELKHQVDRNEKRANGGIAGAMAMTAIPSVPGHDFSFGMATSGYRGQGAIAAGVKANITQNTTASLNTAWDSGNGVGVAAGFSVGW